MVSISYHYRFCSLIVDTSAIGNPANSYSSMEEPMSDKFCRHVCNSTRKVGVVVGATPLVIEALPARRKCEGSILHNPSSVSFVENVSMVESLLLERNYVFLWFNGLRAIPATATPARPLQHRAVAHLCIQPSKKQHQKPSSPQRQSTLDISSSGKSKKFEAPTPPNLSFSAFVLCRQNPNSTHLPQHETQNDTPPSHSHPPPLHSLTTPLSHS
ncbi:hypothetical protein BJ165DRAFT_264873 [Panaeolus papilionaceus]|nr:hypothetical protein BJ165DRAFT_264873 [Panaeolus papilionaceus]